VSIPLLDVVAEDADLMVRFGTGHYADVEHVELMPATWSRPWPRPPLCASTAPLSAPRTWKACPCCAARWSPGAPGLPPHGLDWAEPSEGSQFNDIGLMCDGAAAGMGVALVRLKLGAPWLENGTLVRLFATDTIPARTPTTCAGAPAPWTAGNAPRLPSGCAKPWRSLLLRREGGAALAAGRYRAFRPILHQVP
jgi:DNA-binding transcriptional LysR family regulator